MYLQTLQLMFYEKTTCTCEVSHRLETDSTGKARLASAECCSYHGAKELALARLSTGDSMMCQELLERYTVQYDVNTSSG
jgi:hypothetical protein